MTALLKCGKGPAIRAAHLGDLQDYVHGKLPAPPPVVDYYSKVADWGGLLGNDTYGCCTISGAAGLIIVSNSETGQNDRVPDAPEAVDQYFALSGGQDSGLNEQTVLSTWRAYGLFNREGQPGNRIDAFAPVPANKPVAVQQAIACYGAAYLGHLMTDAAQAQFGAGQPWVPVRGEKVIGGHCTVAVGYDAHYIYVRTWGGIARMSWLWWMTYGEECWAVISQAEVEAGRSPMLDLSSLRTDLAPLAHYALAA